MTMRNYSEQELEEINRRLLPRDYTEGECQCVAVAAFIVGSLFTFVCMVF